MLKLTIIWSLKWAAPIPCLLLESYPLKYCFNKKEQKKTLLGQFLCQDLGQIAGWYFISRLKLLLWPLGKMYQKLVLGHASNEGWRKQAFFILNIVCEFFSNREIKFRQLCLETISEKIWILFLFINFLIKFKISSISQLLPPLLESFLYCF